MGADRALKRLALQRVRDIDLWKAPLVRVGEPVGRGARQGRRQRPALPAAGRRERPAARLAVGARAARRARDGRAALEGRAVLELDDVLRDALSDLLADETQYGPVVDERGEVAGVLSIEILAHALQAPIPTRCPRRPTPARRDRSSSPRSRSTTARRDTLRSRTTASARAGSSTTSTATSTRSVEHVYLTRGRGGDRLRDRVRARAARPPPALAGRPDHPDHRDPLHAPEPRGLLPAAADHRARQHHGADRARRLHRC